MNLKQYFDFEGRASRSEYWGVYLISLGLLFPFIFLASVVSMIAGMFGMFFSSVLAFAVLVGLIWLYGATASRRCRDAGLKPWFALSLVFLIFMPPIGLICCIVFGCLPSGE